MTTDSEKLIAVAINRAEEIRERPPRDTQGEKAQLLIEDCNPDRSVAALRNILVEAGGLYVLGTERHESRRIDNQLRGRSGRQGDPGESRFYLSLTDDLMRLFGSERIASLMDRLGAQEGEVLTHSLMTPKVALTRLLVLRRCIRTPPASLTRLLAVLRSLATQLATPTRLTGLLL